MISAKSAVSSLVVITLSNKTKVSLDMSAPLGSLNVSCNSSYRITRVLLLLQKEVGNGRRECGEESKNGGYHMEGKKSEQQFLLLAKSRSKLESQFGLFVQNSMIFEYSCSSSTDAQSC